MAIKGGLKFLRRRMRAIRNLRKVTKAMKMVSSVRLKRAQPILANSQEFISDMEEIFVTEIKNTENTEKEENKEAIAKKSEFSMMWGYKKGSEGKTLFLVVGSDRGLCGAFNSNILRLARQNIDSKMGGQDIIIWAFGRRVSRPLKKAMGEKVEGFENFWLNFSSSKIDEISERIMEKIEKGEIKEIYCIYTWFKSAGTQLPVCEKIFPILVHDVWGRKRIFEPSREEVMKFFASAYLKAKLFFCFQSSVTSEHASRMRAMDMATQNADRVIKQLNLQINKARQEAITKELIDIVNGKNALEMQFV